MKAQNRAERTKETINYRGFINQFPTHTMKLIRQLERTYTKMCTQKKSILFNDIYIYIYIYIY